jgi:hypothetical protein
VLLITCETVAVDTPASRATSLIRDFAVTDTASPSFLLY